MRRRIAHQVLHNVVDEALAHIVDVPLPFNVGNGLLNNFVKEFVGYVNSLHCACVH